MAETIDRRTAFAGTGPVAPALRFDETRLRDYLKAHIDGFDGAMVVSQFRGGQSNPTYKVESASHTLVVRRKPPGPLLPSAHAVEREFRVVSALHGVGFPVPRPYLLCQDEAVIGTIFHVMDFVPGRIFWEPHLPDSKARERAAIYDRLNATLARLHSLDVDALGLGDFGKPAGYVARQVARWSKQYRASKDREIAHMDDLMAWLGEHAPDSGDVALVHGDYRLDNCIVAADGPEIVAVLDWELATLGDPVADFTYHLMQWVMPQTGDGSGVGSLAGHGADCPGLPDMDSYVADYCAHTGRDGIDDLDAYLAYNFFRMAAIFQGIAARARAGNAVSAHAARMAGLVEPMAKTAWAHARKAGA